MGDKSTGDEDEDTGPLRPEEFRHATKATIHQNEIAERNSRRDAVEEKHGSAIAARLQQVLCLDDEALRDRAVEFTLSALAESSSDYSQLSHEDRSRLLETAADKALQSIVKEAGAREGANERDTIQTENAEPPRPLSQGIDRPANHYTELKEGSELPDRGLNDRTSAVETQIGDARAERMGRDSEGSFGEAGREVTQPSGNARGGR